MSKAAVKAEQAEKAGSADAGQESGEQESAASREGQGGASAELYARLTTPFDVTFKDTRGGIELEYITGEQAITRLNETLGVGGWSFRIVEHGIHGEADECWVLGEMTAIVPSVEGTGFATVTRQQFGSQKVKRSRASGTPLDIGFDLKGAATDALKKCASLLGVGLYLWKKEAPAEVRGAPAPTVLHPNGPNGNGVANGAPNGAAAGRDGDLLLCEECGEPLTETRFRDGTNWEPWQLATFGRRKHSRVLCMTHYREANQAKRRAEEALQQVPF
jgi:hypothetical protein